MSSISEQKDPIKFEVSKELHRKFKKDYALVVGNMCTDILKTLASFVKQDAKIIKSQIEDESEEKLFNNGGSTHELLVKKDYTKTEASLAALFYGKKLLILQRGMTDPWMPNFFSLPGGVAKAEETSLETAMREVKEEIGIKPKRLHFIKTVKTKKMGNIHFFAGSIFTDELTLCQENQSYQFIDKSQIDDFDFIPYVKDLIKEMFK
jgi:8-oxo-dGTP pyrophosphatase MutT (NUDIX family)